MRMKVARSLLPAVFVLGLICSVAAASPPSQRRIDLVKVELKRIVCFYDYWGPALFVHGSRLSVEMWFNRDKFDVIVSGNLAGGPGIGYMFLFGRIIDGKPAITGMMANATSDLTGKDSFEGERKRLKMWEFHKDYMLMPADCTPRYDASTPKKRWMIQQIVDTIRYIYTFDDKRGHKISRVPVLTLIIANFNVDYPETLVLVEPFGEVFRLTLHGPLHYDERGGYTWVQIFHPSHDDIEAIRQNGITKRIRCTATLRSTGQNGKAEGSLK